MKKTAIFILCACVAICAISAVFASGKSEAQSVATLQQIQAVQTETKEESATMKDAMPAQEKTNALGALSPEDALAYMKRTENLVIVDVAARRHYERKHFEGAINIPIEELSAAEEDALYMEIPSGRPVLLHCRLGMIVPGAYRRVLALREDIPELSYINGAPLFDEYNGWLSQNPEGARQTNLLGGQSPDVALEYMKNTRDLVIVEVNAPEWKLRTGFTGALHIPYTEMSRRYNEIPAGRPVLLHCGGGIVSVEAYNTLIEKRPDIPELSYIAGAPLVRAYNEWRSAKRN